MIAGSNAVGGFWEQWVFLLGDVISVLEPLKPMLQKKEIIIRL